LDNTGALRILPLVYKNALLMNFYCHPYWQAATATVWLGWPAGWLAGWLRHHSPGRLHIWSRRVRLLTGTACFGIGWGFYLPWALVCGWQPSNMLAL